MWLTDPPPTSPSKSPFSSSHQTLCFDWLVLNKRWGRQVCQKRIDSISAVKAVARRPLWPRRKNIIEGNDRWKNVRQRLEEATRGARHFW